MTLFGDRLLDAMHMRDMTAADLSRKANVSEANISRYLSGVSEPTMKNLLILAQALNVSSDWLSGNENDKIVVQVGEQDLLRIYNALSMSGKDKVLEYAEMLLAKERKDVQR